MKAIRVFLFIEIVCLTSCTSIKQISDLVLVSTRNIDTKSNDYVELQRNVGDDDNLLKDNKAPTIKEAINNTVKSVQNGEYLMNAKIYKVGDEYAASGDVWGKKRTEPISYYGFKESDRVYKKQALGSAFKLGTIQALTNDKKCLVLWDGRDKPTDEYYSDLTVATNEMLKSQSQQTVSQPASLNGFQVGDKVKIYDKGTWYTGVIIELTNDTKCKVKWDDGSIDNDIKYGDLKKIQ
jgi:hypothetical protein